MKKFIAFVFIALALLFSQTTLSLSSFSKTFFGTHTFFSTENFKSEKTSTTKNGNGFLIECSTKNAEEIFSKLNLSKIDGESFCVKSHDFKITNFLNKLNAKIIKTENTQNIKIVYAFSPKFPNFVLIDGQKVNLQIAQNFELTTIGTPLILGGFWWKKQIFNTKNTKKLKILV